MIAENNSGNTTNNMYPVLFGKSSYFEFIYRKSEKLGIALYMVTSFIKDNDPIKTKIRENAILLVSEGLSLGIVSLSERKHAFKKCEALIVELISLISMAFHSGTISEMNYSVLKSGFEALLESINSDEYSKGKEETVSLSSSFFDIGQNATIKDPGMSFKNNSLSLEQKLPSTNKSEKPFGTSKNSTSFIKDIKKSYVSGAEFDRKNNREEIIFGLLKKKQGLNIKDFAEFITNCSEKTIQRELIHMVNSGIIRKEGERRWSKYYLA